MHQAESSNVTLVYKHMAKDTDILESFLKLGGYQLMQLAKLWYCYETACQRGWLIYGKTGKRGEVGKAGVLYVRLN